MKKSIMKTVVFIAISIILWGTSQALAEEQGPTASADVGVLSKYVWRGYELSDDSFVVQPSVTVGYKGFSINLWGNVDSDFDDMDPAVPNSANWTETDFTFGYDTSIGPLGLGIGYIYYGLDGLEDTQEVYVSVGYDVFLSPTLTVYRDIGSIPGWYLNLGLSHSIPLPRDITFDISGSLGYYISNDDNFVEVDKVAGNFVNTTKKYSSAHDGLISVGLTIPLDKYITVTPVVSYSFPLSDKADNLLTSTSFSNDSSFLYGGASLSISF